MYKKYQFNQLIHLNHIKDYTLHCLRSTMCNDVLQSKTVSNLIQGSPCNKKKKKSGQVGNALLYSRYRYRVGHYNGCVKFECDDRKSCIKFSIRIHLYKIFNSKIPVNIQNLFIHVSKINTQKNRKFQLSISSSKKPILQVRKLSPSSLKIIIKMPYTNLIKLKILKKNNPVVRRAHVCKYKMQLSANNVITSILIIISVTPYPLDNICYKRIIKTSFFNWSKNKKREQPVETSRNKYWYI
ncbi:hypothetical protein AGLY_012390, partial [Aphis glycines]